MQIESSAGFGVGRSCRDLGASGWWCRIVELMLPGGKFNDKYTKKAPMVKSRREVGGAACT